MTVGCRRVLYNQKVGVWDGDGLKLIGNLWSLVVEGLTEIRKNDLVLRSAVGIEGNLETIMNEDVGL